MKKKSESPEEEVIRMEAIKVNKAQFDAAIEASQKMVDEAVHLGSQLPAAMKKAAEEAIKGMGKELDELHWKTEVVPPKDQSTHTCLNTGEYGKCKEMPKRMNFRCDLCGEINNKL